MTIKNLTQNTTLTTDLKECISFKDKNLGLLDPKNPRSLLFKTRFGIHTFGLREAIDVLILQSVPQRHAELVSASGEIPKQVRDDKNNNATTMKVTTIKTDLKPNRVFFWNPLFSIVIELPKETLTKSHTNVGDVLEIIY